MIPKLILVAESTLLLSVAALYIIHCPFTKVEESFNTQAVHDVVNLLPDKIPGHAPNNVIESEIAVRNSLHWDHIEFPGVVPRTFIGALVVGLIVKIIKFLISCGLLLDNLIEEEESDLTLQFVLQILARFILASGVVITLTCVTRALHQRYGLGFRICFLMNIISQFHYLYYAGRFLPNTFAAILANLVFASWIKRHYSKSIIYIAFCVVIFRFDTAIFFGMLLIDAVFIKRQLALGRVLAVGIPAGLVALCSSFIVDSVFWTRPVWPEFEGFYFNVWLNKSHEWGTQPFFYYIYNSIPRILMASGPFLLVAEHRMTRDYLIPTLAFILTYSFLPHKELRFILFTSPFLNICATSGLMNIHYYLQKLFSYLRAPQNNRINNTNVTNPQAKTRQNNPNNEKPKPSSLATMMFTFVLLGLLVANLFCSTILARISNHNYPGGNALLSLGVRDELAKEAKRSIMLIKSNSNQIENETNSRIGVYITNLAAQTGATRFIQVSGVYYSKTPKLDERTFQRRYEQIFLILEPKEVNSFRRNSCTGDQWKRAEDWARGRSTLECRVPNQGNLSCLIEEGVTALQRVDQSGLFKRLASWTASIDDEDTFIKTRAALYIINCKRRD